MKLVSEFVEQISNRVECFSEDVARRENLWEMLLESDLFDADVEEEQTERIMDLLTEHEVDEINDEGLCIAILLTILITNSVDKFKWDSYEATVGELKTWL